jgi:hypothetical protein
MCYLYKFDPAAKSVLSPVVYESAVTLSLIRHNSNIFFYYLFHWFVWKMMKQNTFASLKRFISDVALGLLITFEINWKNISFLSESNNNGGKTIF